MKIRVLEKVKAFPFDGYRLVSRYPNIEFITAEYLDGIEYFSLHRPDGSTATFNTVDYIIEFQ